MSIWPFGRSKTPAVKKFNEPLSTAVFTTKFVSSDKKDITYVTHYEDDGAWQFLSDDSFDDMESVAKIISLGECLELDQSLLQLADMQPGYCAIRENKNSEWVIKKLDEV